MKSSRKTAVCLVLCLLGLALLSNRYLILGQFAVQISETTSFHLPLDESTPAQTGGRRLFLALPNEEALDAQQLVRDTISITPDAEIALRDSRFTSTLQTDPPPSAPSFTLQSVLNL